ncbi:DUF1405 domain-containing protein [Paenibacillus sp. J22TS3]|uniref:DUF1405 domain-containing protein n=1 Tax=Paenibacillus sp. J22TS3 TaxID=2807192 RepID=UPI001B1C03AF|nr:DUF1405 domain-containing protein [Paenibacillus sp. J22TS3]GIP20080.1 hypothetical protein J22TS3_03550 [Paenibacillus sp. J22TS3]
MSISYWWSREFLTSRGFLWLLFVFNLLGTIYGYYWYGNQIEYTIANNPLWQVIFVPDSPTASLFFTLSLTFLMWPKLLANYRGVRVILEALAVVTSVKYGVWAVSIIFAGAYQGNVIGWQDWMLVASHTAMAVEALLYVRFFKFGTVILLGAGLWTLLNDMVDYTYEVFPWLPVQLMDDLPAVRNFTVLLTLLSVAAGWFALRQARRS